MTMQMEATEGLTRPPLAGEGDDGYEPDDWDTIDDREDDGYDDEPIARGAVPLNPIVIKMPLSALGRILNVLTSYEGWVFTEQELNDLAELWAACGVRMSPMVQATVGTSALFAAKAGGYAAWVRAGRPNLNQEEE